MHSSVKFISLISLMVLTSCSSVKSPSAIKVVKSYDKEVITTSTLTLEYMIDNKFTFPLLMYTESCSYCDKARENADKAVKETGIEIYQIEIFYASQMELISKYPTLFKEGDQYPKMYFFDEGKLSYDGSYDSLTNYSAFKRMIKSQCIDTNIFTLTTLDGYSEYKNKKQNYLIFTYDSKSEIGKEIYSNYLYSAASNSNKNTLIIDKNTANSNLISEINNEFENGFSTISIIENGQIKTTLDYSSQSGNEIKNLFDTFFGINTVDSSR